MKRILTALAAAAIVLGALVQCTPYDDSWIKEEISDLKAQIANLQKSVSALDAYKTLLDKSRLISEVQDHGDGTFTIYFADGSAPVTLDAGQGEKGQDGVTPDFKIEDGDWYASYDGGVTWTKIGTATAGDSFFKSVSLEGDYLILVLIDGTQVKINLKGGQGGSEGGGEEGGDEDTPATIEQWAGKWSIDEFTISLVPSGKESMTFNYGLISIPLEYDAATGDLLMKMPMNRFIGGSTSAGIGVSYYLNLYDHNNNRLTSSKSRGYDPAEGDLICTIKMGEDKNSAVVVAADPDYYYFYARGYDNENGKWESLDGSFYLYTDGDKLTRSEGGDDDPQSDITYTRNQEFKFQYYNYWFYVNAATGNYAFWTVPVSSGSLDDETFVKTVLDDFGTRLAAGSDGTVDATKETNTNAFCIFTGSGRYTTAPYYCSNGQADADHNYYVFLVGVDVTDGIRLTGEYNAITINWN